MGKTKKKTTKKRILIIDDEEVFCLFVKMNLESTGRFDVITTQTGSVGIALAKKEKPDLILLDILMPEMSGTEVSQQLMKATLTKNIPIIFLTALVQKDEISGDEGMIGGRHVLAKPVTTDELVTKIDSILKRRTG